MRGRQEDNSLALAGLERETAFARVVIVETSINRLVINTAYIKWIKNSNPV